MKQIFFLLLLVFSTSSNFGQDQDLKDYINNLKVDSIQLDQITIDGVNFYSNKQELIDGLGKPDSIVNPHYECGGFSDDGQAQIFIQYFYQSFNFIGSNDAYQIEKINFQNNDLISINFKGFKFNNETKINVFKGLFPKSYKSRSVKAGKSNYEGLTLLPSILSDDRTFFTFKDGLLVEFEYWTPC